MFRKMKKWYAEWKGVVTLIIYVLTGALAVSLADTAPIITFGIVLIMGVIALSSFTEE